MDRVAGFEPVGWEFESLRAYSAKDHADAGMVFFCFPGYVPLTEQYWVCMRPILPISVGVSTGAGCQPALQANTAHKRGCQTCRRQV